MCTVDQVADSATEDKGDSDLNNKIMFLFLILSDLF